MTSPHALLMLVAAGAVSLAVLVLFLAVLHWFRSQPGLQPRGAVWRRGDAPGLLRTLGWMSTLVLGMLTTAVLVVLAAALTWQVADGIIAAEPAVAASATSATPMQRSDSKDAVSNAMSAVALVVTAVSLVLTVSAVLLGKELKSQDRQRALLDKALQRVHQWTALERQRLSVQVLLRLAIDAAKDWVITEGGSPDLLLSQVMTIANQLEMLSMDDRQQRGKSFDVLAQYFDTADADIALNAVRNYCEACHQLAIARAWYDGHIADPAGLELFQRDGLWCRLFDEQEVRRRIGAL